MIKEQINNKTYYGDRNMTSIIRTDFPRVLKSKILEKHISCAELARLIDVSDTTIHRYVSGKAVPRELLLNRLINVFNCSKYEFIKKY